MKLKKTVKLPLIIFAIGLAITMVLTMTKGKAERKVDKEEQATLVRVMKIQPSTKPMVIRAYASTKAAKELNLSSQVSGRVIHISKIMTEGGRAKRGEVLFKIDPADYQLNVLKAQAGLAQAEYNLDNALAQQKSARQGLESYKRVQSADGKKVKVSALALYGPQIKNAKAAFASAEATLKQAQLNLGRTHVRAPFDGYFRAVTIAEGQNISMNQAVASYFAQSPVQLMVTLPLSELPWVKAQEEGQIGAKARLSKKIGQQVHNWQGVVTHRLLEIDSLGHMAQVVVEVDETLSDKGFPLPIGMQVEVEIQGEEVSEAISIPIYAIRSNNQAWVVSKENRLEVITLQILRKDQGQALVGNGLAKGDLLVTSPIETAMPGMSVKVYQPPVAIEEKP